MFELTIAMALWGTLGVFVLWSQLFAIDIAFYRCLIGVLCVGTWLMRSGQKICLNRSTLIVALAGVFLVLNWVLLFKSFQVSTITIGNVSYYLQPIMLIILSIFVYKEKVSLQKWMIIAMALCGVLLTIDLHNLASPHILSGVFLALLAALFYSFLTILMKRITLHHFTVIFIQLAIGVVILLPFVHFQALSVSAIICLMVIGVVHTLLAYFLYYRAIQKTSFSQIATLSYLDPIVAIATDVIFFHRQLNFWQIFGLFLTFAALYWLVVVGQKQVICA